MITEAPVVPTCRSCSRSPNSRPNDGSIERVASWMWRYIVVRHVGHGYCIEIAKAFWFGSALIRYSKHIHSDLFLCMKNNIFIFQIKQIVSQKMTLFFQKITILSRINQICVFFLFRTRLLYLFCISFVVCHNICMYSGCNFSIYDVINNFWEFIVRFLKMSIQILGSSNLFMSFITLCFQHILTWSGAVHLTQRSGTGAFSIRA